ncbi:hypothetical protein K7432_014639 [Basidiobolus ranarum]|uniref:Uncharacterized protein n=1 Tax=Basidiobolus ranarum TaxID=34480 RepID=A0ABR2WHA7_9FUNG
MSNTGKEFKDGEIVNSVGYSSEHTQQTPIPGHVSTAGAYQEKPLPPLPSTMGRNDASTAGSRIHQHHVVDNPSHTGSSSTPVAAPVSGNVHRHDNTYEHDQAEKKNHVPRDGSPTRETFETLVNRDREPHYQSYAANPQVSSNVINDTADRNRNESKHAHKKDEHTTHEKSHVPRDGSPTRETFETMVGRDKKPEYVSSHNAHNNAGINTAPRTSELIRNDKADKDANKPDRQNNVPRDGNPDREHFEYITERDKQPSTSVPIASTGGSKPSSTSMAGSSGITYLDRNNPQRTSENTEHRGSKVPLVAGIVGTGASAAAISHQSGRKNDITEPNQYDRTNVLNSENVQGSYHQSDHNNNRVHGDGDNRDSESNSLRQKFDELTKKYPRDSR